MFSMRVQRNRHPAGRRSCLNNSMKMRPCSGCRTSSLFTITSYFSKILNAVSVNSEKNKAPERVCIQELWCEGGDLNPHGVYHTHLKRARLPIPPPSHIERYGEYPRHAKYSSIQVGQKSTLLSCKTGKICGAHSAGGSSSSGESRDTSSSRRWICRVRTPTRFSSSADA